MEICEESIITSRKRAAFGRLHAERMGLFAAKENCVMRDYALHRAESLGEFGPVSDLGRLFRNWKARRTVARLEDFDDYMLRDIGVTRADIHWAAGLPLSVNAALALEERAFQRRRAEPFRR
jgi:uncharacterized protein YjiS (DUF1127 family)